MGSSLKREKGTMPLRSTAVSPVPSGSEELTTQTQRHREETTEKRKRLFEKDDRRPAPDRTFGNANDPSYPGEFSVLFFSVPLCLCG
jgi:hypothetical protein